MPKSSVSIDQHNESSSSTRIYDEEEREITLKDRQEAMNQSHPFGLPLWKPALYKKSRSIVRSANRALHSVPSSTPELFLNPGNILWSLLLGWWLSLIVCMTALVMFLVDKEYSRVLIELASYLLWPFGRSVEMTSTEEQLGLLSGQKTKRRYLGFSSILYYLLFFSLIGPLLFLVSVLCWLCVISIPMAKLNYILIRHLYQHPLSLRFKSTPSSSEPTTILLCTYQAIGLQYYKYTYDGINILFINLLPLVFFVILDDWFLKDQGGLTSSTVIFLLSLASVIPLSYFIGMAVSSISAQSSMGVGAVINATFGSIIEIILYAVALISGKSNLVEGALIGSFLAGVLLMPGCSMVSGAIKRKEQRFNAKSAGVTSTMLIMAIIGALTPTLFYQLYGSFELKCIECPEIQNGTLACSKCYYDQLNPTHDPVYQNSVKPLMWLCAAILPSAYIIGLVFSLHTHVDMVWKDKNKASLTYYQRLMPTHLFQLIHPSSQRNQTTKPHLAPVQIQSHHPVQIQPHPSSFIEIDDNEEDEGGAGHDSPNWSKNKSFLILFGCTLLYSIIAEILVDTVDEVMKDYPMNEKFLGLTLFALVPNITEFMNAISFAMYGNIVLSMEIGSAYALQVCLLQIPAMVAFSVWYNAGKEELAQFTFSLVFPRWDKEKPIISKEVS
ncbi:hypothetical protein EDC96DRAFT_609892 [Choanephora cucurbitarum]|nr:hypothetical protein EDC96DRAFT_609892 [Choanephora cucurbitarum]